MEHRPNPNERYGSESELERTIESLPPPEEAGGILTAALSDMSSDFIFEAQARGTDIGSYAARIIAYNLTAHAPHDAETTQLRQYYQTGEGRREDLRDEYLPLRLDPRVPSEGQILIDALGTHLLNDGRDQHRARQLARVSLVTLTHRDGTRQALLFKTGRDMVDLGHAAHVMRLSRIAHELGDAFLAYLRVPGVDATDPDIEDQFFANYIGGHRQALSVQTAPDTHEPLASHEIEVGGQIYVFHA